MQSYSKQNSPVEALRKPVSFAGAVLIVAAEALESLHGMDAFSHITLPL